MSSSADHPAKPRRLGLIALVVAIIAAILAAIAITVSLLGNASQDDAAGGIIEITYEVTGSGGQSDDIVYTDFVDGETESVHASGEFPWAETVTVDSEDFFVASLRVSAQVGDGGGSITCRILVDGEVIAEESRSGRFEVVGCRG